MVKYFVRLCRGSIETKGFKTRQTADNNPAYKIYLLKVVQCLGHENELRKLSHIYIYIYIYIHIHGISYVVHFINICTYIHTYSHIFT